MRRRSEEACEQCGVFVKKKWLFLSTDNKWLCLRCQPSHGPIHAAMSAWDARGLWPKKKSDKGC